jgi:hypothetical protein
MKPQSVSKHDYNTFSVDTDKYWHTPPTPKHIALIFPISFQSLLKTDSFDCPNTSQI